MTERRPHWDDDLIDAVRDGMSVEVVAAIGGEAVATSTYIPSDDDVYNVIGAVEDWQKPSLDDLQRENLRDLVDAIQAVREYIAGAQKYAGRDDGTVCDAVLSILDGPA